MEVITMVVQHLLAAESHSLPEYPSEIQDSSKSAGFVGSGR